MKELKWGEGRLEHGTEIPLFWQFSHQLLLVTVVLGDGDGEKIETCGRNSNQTEWSESTFVIKIVTVWPWQAAIFRVGDEENRKRWRQSGLMRWFLLALWIPALGGGKLCSFMWASMAQPATVTHTQGLLCAETTCTHPCPPPTLPLQYS